MEEYAPIRENFENEELGVVSIHLSTETSARLVRSLENSAKSSALQMLSWHKSFHDYKFLLPL